MHADRRYASMKKERSFGGARHQHRGLLALTYGRSGNGFSDSHERAFHMRNVLTQNLTMCGGVFPSGCSIKAMKADVAARPLARSR